MFVTSNKYDVEWNKQNLLIFGIEADGYTKVHRSVMSVSIWHRAVVFVWIYGAFVYRWVIFFSCFVDVVMNKVYEHVEKQEFLGKSADEYV